MPLLFHPPMRGVDMEIELFKGKKASKWHIYQDNMCKRGDQLYSMHYQDTEVISRRVDIEQTKHPKNNSLYLLVYSDKPGCAYIDEICTYCERNLVKVIKSMD